VIHCEADAFVKLNFELITFERNECLVFVRSENSLFCIFFKIINVYQKYTKIEMTALEFLIFYKKNRPDILKHLREKCKKPVCGVVVVRCRGFSRFLKNGIR
jgi:hypothetical protein